MRVVGKGTLATVCWVGPEPMTLMTWPSTLLVDATLKKTQQHPDSPEKITPGGPGKGSSLFFKEYTWWLPW